MSQILTKLSVIERIPNSFRTEKNERSTVLNNALKETDKVILERIDECIKTNISSSYQNIIKKALINKENYERGFFVRMGYELFKLDWKNISSALASVELRYSNLVVTDDIFDNNDVRMRAKSIRNEYGDNTAISIAAILKSLSSIELTKQLEKFNINYSELTKLDEISHILIYEGQLMDLSTEQMQISELNEQFYIELIKKTTGDDVGFCFELGGRLAGCTEEQALKLRKAGTSLGTAMQTRDDLIDYVNDNTIINKRPLRDFSSRKLRLPLYLAYKFANPAEKEKIVWLYKKGINNSEDAEFISQMVFREEVLIYIENILSMLKKDAYNSFFSIETNNSHVLDFFDSILNDVVKV